MASVSTDGGLKLPQRGEFWVPVVAIRRRSSAYPTLVTLVELPLSAQHQSFSPSS